MSQKNKDKTQKTISYYECDACGYPFKHNEIAIYSAPIRAEGKDDMVNFVVCPNCEELLVFEEYCYIARTTRDTEEEFERMRKIYEEHPNAHHYE